ncbi:uncharacterized protein [Anser cygnoides]|uniref:uncharacterized protein isoform X2 n=1 Tax=Anser cygnoides TaxID=8845 RepID=UPI0034D288D1
MPKRKGRAASFFYGSWLWAAASSPSTASSSSSSGPGGEPKTPRSCLEPALPGSPSCTPDPHTPFRRRISMRNTNERKMLWAIPPPKDRSLLKTHPKRLVCSQTGLVRETVPKKVLWRGSGRTLPLPGKRTEPVKSTAPPGPLRAKDKAERVKPSLRSSHITGKIRKYFEKAAPGLVRETVPKEVLWRGSGRKLPLPGKITGATQATAPPEVSPGRALPDPRLLPALEPSWYPRGPLRAKDKAERVKPSLRSSHITGKIRKYFEKAAPGLVRETVPKEVLWRGSGRKLPLPGKITGATQATAPPEVSPGRALPDPRLLPALEPSWYPRGPLRAKDKAERVKPSLRSSHITGKIRKYFEKAAPGLVRETVPKEVLWRGSGRKLPLPGKITGATQATAPPGPLRAKDKAKGRKLSVRYSHIIEEIRKDLEKAAPGVDGENNANTAKPQNFRSYSVGGAVAFLVLVLLGTVACCVLCACGALEAEKPAPRHSPGSPDIDTRSRSVSPYRQPDHRGTPESQARHQRPPSVPGRPTRLPPARPPQPPRTAADQWKARDRPSIPQSSWTQTSPPQPPPPSSNGWGSPPRGAALAIPSINIE